MRLDALRGLMLVIMAAVHVPTLLSHWLQEPFGFTSDAEGFVFLSAVLAGRVYGGHYHRSDWRTMAERVWKRAKLVYIVHVSLVLAALLTAWALASRFPPLANHFHDFLTHPWGSLALVPLMLHQPPLFDILPLYVRMLGLTPWLLLAARRWGWRPILMISALGWGVAQLQPWQHLVGDPARLLPLRLGSFHFLAWQFLWVCGMALGETMRRQAVIPQGRRSMVGGVAGAIVLLGLVCRHGIWPAAWFPPGLYEYMDKWSLGPLRLLNFGAWVAFLMAWNPALPRLSLAPLALLGRNSLAVFAFHLPLVIVATTIVQTSAFSTTGELFVAGLVIAEMFAWGAWLESTWRKAPKAPPPTGAVENPTAPDLVPA